MFHGKFRMSLRTVLIIVLVTILVTTVSIVGITTLLAARKNTIDLTQQYLEAVSQTVDERIQRLLDSAVEESMVTVGLLGSERTTIEDFEEIAKNWLAVMNVHTNLSYMSISLESTGELMYVTRMPESQYPGGRLSIRQTRLNPVTGHLEAWDYWPEDYPTTPYFFAPDRDRGDPRKRPWYIDAREAGKPIWSKAYLFIGQSGTEEVPGVSYATPIYDHEGRLLAVLTADFDVFSLCDFFKGLRREDGGYVFLVEVRDEGHKVIAHPDPDILIRLKQVNPPLSELVPLENLRDGVVRGFMEHVQVFLAGNGNRLPETVVPLRFTHDGTPYLAGFCSLQAGKSESAPNWLIGMVVKESAILGTVNRNRNITAMVGAGSLIVAILLSIVIASRVATPLRELTREAEAIGRLKLEPKPNLRSSITEINRLISAAEGMKAGLRSFQKYVPANLVRELMASGEEARLGGMRQVLTVYFADIVGFTPLAEELEPDVLVALLSEYNESMSRAILESGGTLDKYMGDAIMAFWGAPVTNPQHALNACRAAIRSQKCLRVLRRKWVSQGKPALRCRIGISTGELVVGNMGSQSRINYTVLGDTVNLASRLEGLNGFYGTGILMSEATFRQVEEQVVARPVDRVSVKGKSEAILAYELLGLKDDTPQTLVALVREYASALEAYFMGNWEEAGRMFEAILRAHPNDGPSQEMLGRCRRLAEGPAPEDWDGIQRMEYK